MTGDTAPNGWRVIDRDNSSQSDVDFTVISPEGEYYSALMDRTGQFAYQDIEAARPSLVIRESMREAVMSHLFDLACGDDLLP
jgi:hypothetical protein